jgi:aspartate aminotransferase
MGFLSQFYKPSKEIWISDPTWGNHIPIAETSGLTVKRYRWVASWDGLLVAGGR